jgi:hypothetical protein
MSEIKLSEIQSLYEQATIGQSAPEIWYAPLGSVRHMAERFSDVRADIREFLELTKDMPEGTPVLITLSEIGIVE